jgi:hypothetical protein
MATSKRSRGNSLHTSCTQSRRMLIEHFTLNMNTGESTPKGSEWVERECGVPLFTDAERTRGTCRSCAGGWKTDNNYPIEKL